MKWRGNCTGFNSSWGQRRKLAIYLSIVRRGSSFRWRRNGTGHIGSIPIGDTKPNMQVLRQPFEALRPFRPEGRRTRLWRGFSKRTQPLANGWGSGDPAPGTKWNGAGLSGVPKNTLLNERIYNK